MNSQFKKKLMGIVLIGLMLTACSNQSVEVPNETYVREGILDEKAGLRNDELGHQGHDPRGNETSDLDRPVSELFAASCEHNIKTYKCDFCRYEVGVVKAEKSLFEGGLLQKAKAERRAISFPLKLTGEVRFDERRVAHVSTQTRGIVKHVHVTLGDRVKRGQALFVIESVSIGEAQAVYLESRGMLTLAKRSHDRIDLLRREGISSERELLAAKQTLDALQIRTDAAFGKLTRRGMSSFAARALTPANAKGQLVLRAPFDGTVLGMHAVAGEVARVDTSLATIGDNSSVWVWADLYERDIASVFGAQKKKALAAVVEVKAFQGEEFKGRVDFVSPSMSESSRTVKVRIDVPNPDRRLLSGMFAQVKVFVPGDQRVLAVPRQAVLEDEGRAFVFIHHEGDYYVRRPVSGGRTFGGLREITDGLAGNEVVVVNGAFLMKSDVLRSKMGAGCAD
jgi:cobalt-zinc-cadmium efflux system membrane fusion protein